jgi:hypothetical protein
VQQQSGALHASPSTCQPHHTSPLVVSSHLPLTLFCILKFCKPANNPLIIICKPSLSTSQHIQTWKLSLFDPPWSSSSPDLESLRPSFSDLHKVGKLALFRQIYPPPSAPAPRPLHFTTAYPSPAAPHLDFRTATAAISPCHDSYTSSLCSASTPPTARLPRRLGSCEAGTRSHSSISRQSGAKSTTRRRQCHKIGPEVCSQACAWVVRRCFVQRPSYLEFTLTKSLQKWCERKFKMESQEKRKSRPLSNCIFVPSLFLHQILQEMHCALATSALL